MTKRQYNQDAYQKELKSKVVSCEPCEFGYEIKLEETIFYPEGGGQPGDEGCLDTIRVYDTVEKEDDIIHMTKEPLCIGVEVTEKIDWERRLRLSQQHSGEHIFSGVVHREYGYDNVGFHMGKDYVTVDFNGTLQDEQIKEIEGKVNAIILGNYEIEIHYPNEEAQKTLQYRSKKELSGSIRIVTIPNADVCACCGTHVKTTGEIGMLKVIAAETIRGGSRLTLKIGWTAWEDYEQKHRAVKAISKILSVQPEQTTAAVEKLKNTVQELKFELIKLREERLEEKVSQIEETKDTVLLIEEGLTAEDTRKLCDKLMKKANMAAVFSGKDEEGYFYVLGSETVDVALLGTCLKSTFLGQGGGKNPMVQGKINATQKQIRNFFAD